MLASQNQSSARKTLETPCAIIFRQAVHHTTKPTLSDEDKQKTEGVNMFQKIIRVLGGDPQKREIERLTEKVEQVNALEKSFEALSDDALYAKTEEFRTRYRQMLESGMKKQEALDELLPCLLYTSPSPRDS